MSKLINKLSKEKILQLSNDLSLGYDTGTVQDWRAVANYALDELSHFHNKYVEANGIIAGFLAAQDLYSHSLKRSEEFKKEKKKI